MIFFAVSFSLFLSMLPTAGFSRLSKGILHIVGPDSAKFLNGLVTTRFLPNIVKKNQYTISDVELKHANLSKIINLQENWGIMHEDIFDPDNEILVARSGVYSMFLNSKGRVITDSFIYPTEFNRLNDNKPSYLVEVDNTIKSKLQMILNMHKLTANVKLLTPDFYSYYYYNDSLKFDEFLEHLQQTYFGTYTPRDALKKANEFIDNEIIVNKKFSGDLVGLAIDNRIPNFGVKFITKAPISEEFFSDKFKAEFEVKPTDEKSIADRRYINGLFESGDASTSSSLLPFDMNLDYINGLSLDKGCYVGQELTIRTFNSGVVRKRIVPVQFFDMDATSSSVHSDELELINSDPVIEHLAKINCSTIDKFEITPLIEDKDTSADSDSPAPAPSPFGGALKPRKHKVGKLVSVHENLGFALINLKDIHKTFFKFEIPELNNTKVIGMKILKPTWWPEDEL